MNEGDISCLYLCIKDITFHNLIKVECQRNRISQYNEDFIKEGKWKLYHGWGTEY